MDVGGIEGGKEGGKDNGRVGGCGQKRFRGDAAYIKNRVNAARIIDPNDNFVFVNKECNWCSSGTRTYYLTVNCAADEVLHTSERKRNPKTKKIAFQGNMRRILYMVLGGWIHLLKVHNSKLDFLL